MNGWFPAINGRGEIVSGAGEIFFQDQSLGRGWSPRFVDDDTVVFNDGMWSVLINVRTGARQTLPPVYNAYAGGGGYWMGLLQASPTRLDLHRGGSSAIQSWTECGGPAMAPSGRYVFSDRFHELQHTVFVGSRDAAPRAIFSGETMTLSVCDGAVVVQLATGTYTRAIIGLVDGQPAKDWSVFDWEDPVACDGPDGPWVLSVTQAGLILRPGGSKQGYAWTGSGFFNPAIRFVNGVFLIACADTAGQRVVFTVNPHDPRVPLGPATPPPPPEDDVFKKCEVTVDAFALSPANHLPDGTLLEFHDRENQKGAMVRVWVEGGSCRMSIDYPGAGTDLKGETGARRPVR